MSKPANICFLDYTIQEVDVREGKKGSFAIVKGYYVAQDKDGNILDVPVRCVAFGTIADRFGALSEGDEVRVVLEMGGYKSEKSGYTNPDYTCVSVSRPWPKQETDGGGMKRGKAAARPRQEDVDDAGEPLPF